MRHSLGGNRVHERLNNVRLPDHIVKCAGSIFSGRDLVVHLIPVLLPQMLGLNCQNCESPETYGMRSLTHGEVGPGDPAAHRTGCLPLLPSGSSGVHRVLLHRAQPLFSNLNPQNSPRLRCVCSPSQRLYEVGRGSVHTTCGMAERVGFEPTVPLPRRMLSKHVDSSTLAPLRIEKCKGAHLSMRVQQQQGVDGDIGQRPYLRAHLWCLLKCAIESKL